MPARECVSKAPKGAPAREIRPQAILYRADRRARAQRHDTSHPVRRQRSCDHLWQKIPRSVAILPHSIENGKLAKSYAARARYARGVDATSSTAGRRAFELITLLPRKRR